MPKSMPKVRNRAQTIVVPTYGYPIEIWVSGSIFLARSDLNDLMHLFPPENPKKVN